MLAEKLRRIHQYRRLYTYEGVVEQIERWFEALQKDDTGEGEGVASNSTTFLRCVRQFPPDPTGLVSSRKTYFQIERS